MSTSYSFHISSDVWRAWRATLPDDKALHDRVARLLVADLLGDASILEETAVLDEPSQLPQVDATREEFLSGAAVRAASGGASGVDGGERR